MSNVSYDLDTSGGLMPLIRALIKPPDEEQTTHKPKKPQHPYYKRPGKGHNRDCCDACSEGGDLICCDRCPASFHLGCYDPPLDENDIPAGLWLCKQCRGSDAEKATSSRSSRAQSPADKSDTDKKTRFLRKKAKDAKQNNKEMENEGEKEIEESKEPKKEPNPMDVLVKAARIMNPKQFELPREMQVPCPFPGTEKEGTKSGSATVIMTDASGCVPLPAKICYVCAATCKRAPLLQCDYCPLLFHQDCLDPPLTALPTGRWMCPNHVEQFIDWKLVNSVSATERVALWDKFSGPVDQHAIKVDFIRRARGNRPFRVKLPVGMRGRVSVPEMVRQHYRYPPPLLPSRREFVRCAKVLRNLKASGTYDESDEEGELTDESKHKICMNLSCPQYSGEGRCPLEANEEQDTEEDSENTEDEVVVETSDDPGIDGKEDQPVESTSDQHSSEEDQSVPRKRKHSSDGSPNKAKKSSKPVKLRLRETKSIKKILATAEEQLKDLDSTTIKVLAYQMMQQIAAGEQVAGRWRRCKIGTWATRATEAIGSGERAALQKLGVRLMPLPSALLPDAERQRIARLVWGAPDSPAPARQRSPAEQLADGLVRAAFCPVNRPPPGTDEAEATLGEPVAMRSSTFRVGTQAGCDLRLERSCRRVSDTHALIFCDQVTQHFELINYSEWGTCVNGILYACDTGPRAAERAAPPAPSAARRPERNSTCRCPAVERDTAGAWEGGALLPHGSLLQFGCQMFVFSLLDQCLQ